MQTIEERTSRGCRVFLQYDTGQGILDSLEFGNGKLGNAVEDRVAIVKLGADQGMTNKLDSIQIKGGPDVAEGTWMKMT